MISLTINANHGIDFPIRVKQTMTPNDITLLLSESINLNYVVNNSSNSDEDLMQVLYKNISYEYVYNGRLLNSYLSLASQGVTDGSKLNIITNINVNTINLQNNPSKASSPIYEHSQTQQSDIQVGNVNNILPKLSDDNKKLLKLKILENKSKSFSTQSEKIASLLTESFRIYDSHFSSIERYPRSQISYQRMLQMVHNEIEDEQEVEPESKTVIVNNSNKEPSTSPLPALNLNSDYDESEEFDEFIMEPMFESIEQAGKLFAKNPWSEWTW